MWGKGSHAALDACGRRLLRLLSGLGAVAALTMCVPPHAAADNMGSNDNFANADDLGSSLPVSAVGLSWGATAETGEPAHAGSPASQSVWYSWTAGSGGQVKVDVCDSDTREVVRVAVYTGVTLQTLSSVASSAGGGCTATFDATLSTTYKIAVDSGSSFVIQLHRPGTPTNDNFASSQAVPSDLGVGQFIYGEATSATAESAEPQHAGNPAAHSIWYSWTAPSNSAIYLDLCASEFPVRIAVYTGSSLVTLTPVEDNGQFSDCRLTLYPSASADYRIAIDPFSQAGDVKLKMGPEHPPANDFFVNAQSLVSGITSGGGTGGATAEPGEPDHAGAAAHTSVWFQWTGPYNSHASFDACGFSTLFDGRLAVYAGASLNALTPVTDNAATGDCRVDFTAVAGRAYRIAVDDDGDGSFGGATFHAPQGPPYDDFATAAPLNSALPVEFDTTNLNATEEEGEPDHAGLPPYYSLWFRWTAPSTGPVAIDTCDSDLDSILAVYTGDSLTGLTPIVGNDDGGSACDLRGGNPYGSVVGLNVVAGQTYRIAVDGWDEGPFVLRLAATGPHVFPPTTTALAPVPIKRACPKGKRFKHGKCVRKKKKRRN